ncbi:hypothetical protein COY27_07220 [Candidatus Woesearchaeota archaeon CG_4_10_14_0_2_um_filter_33_13]|nr:MAG: hypothetical protein COY27_07220 [Candidatus Woesearchaeota archaeon CG_4_10_14_0_2_um_filter_33_13]
MVVEKNVKDVEVYTMCGMATLKGFVMNGLDSSTLINLIVVFDSKTNELSQRGFTFPPHTFFYHKISQSEVIGVLINKHNFTPAEAYESFNTLASQFDLRMIERRDSDEMFEKLVEEANSKIVQKLNNPRLKIGEKDIVIIGGFLREKINFVHSDDEGFLKTCEELGMNIVPTPTLHSQKEKDIKGWMSKRKS